MSQDQSIVKIFLNSEDYDREHLYYIFTNKIVKLSGEGELLPHHEYFINYEKNFVFLIILILIMKPVKKFIQIIKLF